MLWNKSPSATIDYIAKAATAAENLRVRWPEHLVFGVASESTLFMQGILPGETLQRRLAHTFAADGSRSGRYTEPLQAFLAQANATVRKVFHGPVTYAPLIWEP